MPQNDVDTPESILYGEHKLLYPKAATKLKEPKVVGKRQAAALQYIIDQNAVGNKTIFPLVKGILETRSEQRQVLLALKKKGWVARIDRANTQSFWEITPEGEDALNNSKFALINLLDQ